MDIATDCNCQHISKDSIWGYFGDFDVQVVRASAASGCTQCSIFWAMIEPKLNDIKIGSSSLRFRVSASGVRINGKVAGIYIFTDEVFSSEDCGGYIPQSQSLPTDTESDAAFQQVATWIAKCLGTHHTLCNSVSNDSNLPFRVLDLGCKPGDKIILKETNNEPGIYACLSHTWGGHQPLQTTKESISAHKQEIPWEKIPKTFQDAVTCARRMTLQYLWIDSLCIVQDDERDWMIQSTEMASIYGNAVITYSAAGSKGPFDGLFVKSRPEHVGVEVSLPSKVTGGSKFFSRLPLRHESTDHPLLSRGWAFQERLLSPRVLHFGAYELIWECSELRDCHCGRLHGSFSDWGGMRPDEQDQRRFHPTVLAKVPPRFVAQAWRKLAHNYSKMTLTKRTDVLPAISGVAKIMKQCLQNKGINATYLAGMWDCWFIEDCLWINDIKRKKVSRPLEWQAPTFSWMSVACNFGATHYKKSYILTPRSQPGGVERLEEPKPFTLHASLESFKYELKGDDETGPIRSASVVLSGSLLQVFWKNSDIEIRGRPGLMWDDAGPQFHPDYDFSIPGEYYIEDRSTLWGLELISLKDPPKNPVYQFWWCLILRQIAVRDDGVRIFERVGLLQCRMGIGKLYLPLEKWFDPEFVERDVVVEII